MSMTELEKLYERQRRALTIGLWLTRQCQEENSGSLKTSITNAIADVMFIERILDSLNDCTDDELSIIDVMSIEGNTEESQKQFYALCKTVAERLLERGINILEGVERLRRELAHSKAPK